LWIIRLRRVFEKALKEIREEGGEIDPDPEIPPGRLL